MRSVPQLLIVSLSLGVFAWSAMAGETAANVLRIASVAPDGTPWAAGLKEFKTRVEKETGGAIVVRPFLGGVLGDENETVTSCQRGQIQGVGASTGAIASVIPELNVLELPMLFRTEAEADYILDNVILADVEKHFRDRSLVFGFWSENGYRSFGTDFGFIKSPADLKGHKMRSQESSVHLEMYRAYGASPVPIPVTEVLTSMQTGVIDGYDNTALYALAAQWTSVTKYYTLTNHIYQPAAIIFNEAWFDALPAEHQKVLLSARADLAPQMRKEIRALNPLLIENLGAMEVQVYTPTAAEKATFEAPSKVARDTYMKTASAGEKALLAKINAGLETYRKPK